MNENDEEYGVVHSQAATEAMTGYVPPQHQSLDGMTIDEATKALKDRLDEVVEYRKGQSIEAKSFKPDPEYRLLYPLNRTSNVLGLNVTMPSDSSVVRDALDQINTAAWESVGFTVAAHPPGPMPVSTPCPNDTDGDGNCAACARLDRGCFQKIKGIRGGLCNRSACVSGRAAWWYNRGTSMYYCSVCAGLINQENPIPLFDTNGSLCKLSHGSPICVHGEPIGKCQQYLCRVMDRPRRLNDADLSYMVRSVEKVEPSLREIILRQVEEIRHLWRDMDYQTSRHGG